MVERLCRISGKLNSSTDMPSIIANCKAHNAKLSRIVGRRKGGGCY
jgi:hypothetical protein